MSDHLTPLAVCERLIGPYSAIEKIAGRKPKAAYIWARSAQGRSAGDMPADANRSLLAYAAARDIPLTAEHLIWGASVEEIAALEQQMLRSSGEAA